MRNSLTTVSFENATLAVRSRIVLGGGRIYSLKTNIYGANPALAALDHGAASFVVSTSQ